VDRALEEQCKLVRHDCNCDLRKYNFTNRVISTLNSLFDYALSDVNTFKRHLDQDYKADLHGIGNRSITIVILCINKVVFQSYFSDIQPRSLLPFLHVM